MRRLIVEDPLSQAAVWSRRLAVFALAVGGIGVALARGGLDPTSVLAVMSGAVFAACAAILCAGAAVVVIWRTGRRGTGLLLSALLLASLLLIYPGYLAVQALRLPVLNDISTDLDDPPAFSRSRRALAARGGVAPESMPAAAREAQREAYPDVQPVLLDLDADEAYQTVLKAVAAAGWQVIDQTPPGGRSGIGHVDAVARTPVLGFREDVTIRIRPLAGQTRIDLRSASRIGRHDFGGNAGRIVRFAADLESQTGAK